MKSAKIFSAAMILAMSLLVGPWLGEALSQELGLKRVAEVEAAGVPFWMSRQRAEQGDPAAQYQMGRRYEAGDGVPRELEKARRWYLRAARQGNIWAQNNLGRMYGEGLGLTRNYVTSHMWFVIATEGGSQVARSNRDYTGARMTTFEVEKARELAKEWLFKRPIPPIPPPPDSPH